MPFTSKYYNYYWLLENSGHGRIRSLHCWPRQCTHKNFLVPAYLLPDDHFPMLYLHECDQASSGEEPMILNILNFPFPCSRVNTFTEPRQGMRVILESQKRRRGLSSLL